MKAICAWCGKVLSKGSGDPDEPVTHGMCSSCQQLSDDELDRLAAKRAAEKQLRL